ncbi:MAG: TonB-dependent receptor [Bryobacteraceae bacterium]|nr:TonB-dependent receptor [Bryobacteraceae bacterium]
MSTIHTRGSLRLPALASLVFLLVPGASPARAQILYGSMVGVVTDPSNAAVPKATVTILQLETNQSLQTETDQSGQYRFPTIPGGTYELKVTAQGFRGYIRKPVSVSTNAVTRIDVEMQVGSVSESIQVAADAMVLQTDRSEVRAEVGRTSLLNLPVPPGRNYQQLFNTLPGFTPPRNAHSLPSNPSRSLQYEVNGVVAASNNIRLDGATQYNVWLPHVTAYVPALESIETVNVVTNSFDAEQGLAGGAAINVQIKSGTNELHGSGFWYHNNNNTKARPFFLPFNQDKPKLVFNQFGGTVGGPVVKDKLFYFASYEGTYDRQFAGALSTVPTSAMKAGDMSTSPRLVYDPATGAADGRDRTPFPNNQIPLARQDTIALKIVRLMPTPTDPNQLTGNYYSQGTYAFDRNTIDTKVNWIPASRITAYGRFSYLHYDANMPTRFGDQLLGSSLAGGNPGKGFGDTYSFTGAMTYTISPSFIFDTNFGYTKMNTNVEQPFLDQKIGLDTFGIPGTNGTRRFEGGFPGFGISGFDTFGLADSYMPYFRRDPQYQWIGNGNWTKGRHNVRFGAELSWQQLNHTQPEFYGGSWGAPGGFSFNGGSTTLNGGPASNQFNSMSDFLLGLASQVGKIYQWPDVYGTRTSMQSFYLRDQWQVTRQLTLNFGVRYNYFPMPTRDDRGLERYIFPGDARYGDKVLVCGFGEIARDCGVSVSKTLFAPTVGIAYRVNDSTVIRTGYGINTDPWNVARAMRTNHPLLTAQTVNAPNSFSAAGTLKTGIPVLTQPSLGNGVIDLPRTVVANTMDTDFKRGYIQSWNFTIQKQMFWNMVGQVGYVATRSTGLMGFEERNYGLVGGGAASRVYFASTGRNGSLAVVNRLGNSTYDSLQATLDKRLSGGLQMNLAYVWSKCIAPAGFGNSGDRIAIKIPSYQALNRSQCSIHQPQRFTTAAVWQLPFGAGRKYANSGFASAVLGGWQINGILSLMKGQPFTVSSSGASLNAPENSQRADQVKANVTKLGLVGRGVPFYDYTAYAPVTQARFGTSGFNTLLGPGLVSLDMGVFRQFRITERVNLQFRAEAFNATNTPHFSNPSGNISNLVLNPDGTFRSGVFEVTGVRNTGREGIDERVFRFGLRLGF